MWWIHLGLSLYMIYTECSAVENSTCEPVQFSCHNGRCLNIAWKCDGDDDCNDNSDEIGCPSTTCSENSFRCNDGKCIPVRWLCDDSPDCSDNSDEEPNHCRSLPCDGHRCTNSNKCLPELWKCDGRSDCPKGDDEEGCSTVCEPATEFKCNNSECISAKWRCDGSHDCSDKSDEIDCSETVHKCDTGEKMCNDKECVNELYWCDGDADCHDKSDESNCTESVSSHGCSLREFQCYRPTSDIQCIHFDWKCDGVEDCSDGSDEKDCVHSCSSDEKMCGSTCLKAAYFCDGEDDCEGGEDEKNCNITVAPASHCNGNQFDCGSKCISKQLICNGADDCGNGADEAHHLHCPLASNNTCLNNNGGCHHVCIPNTNEKSGRKCECHVGFELNESETECEDSDECSIPGTCSQNCTNTKGSYKCECFEGYTLINFRYCKAIEGNHAELILSDRHGFRRYQLDTFHYSILLQQVVHGAVAMDFDIRNKTVFWTDVHSEKVCSASLESNETKIIVDKNISMPDGLAFDWIHRNLYLSDTGLDRIEVARLDGSHRKTLVNDGLDEPRALVVDPSTGWMYWVDWGDTPKIEKCGMNGQHRKEIVTKGISWPNGLTIDYTQNRLYWVDAKLHSIGSSDLDGNNFKIVLRNHRNLGHPYAITVFEDYLYWTDWMSNAVHRFSKFGRDNVSTIALDLREPMAVHVFHINRQPASVNLCGDNNGGCSHLCLPVPRVKTSSPIPNKSECACADTMILDGQFNCIQSPVTTAKTQQVTDGLSSDSPQTDRQDLKTVVTLEGETTVQSEADASTTRTDSEEAASMNKTHVSMGQRDNEGFIAVTTIGVLLIVGIAVCGVVYYLSRRHKSKNVKSMNFDNPVYRKTTTEDHLIMEKSGSRSSLPQSMQPLNQDNDIV